MKRRHGPLPSENEWLAVVKLCCHGSKSMELKMFVKGDGHNSYLQGTRLFLHNYREEFSVYT